MNAFALPARRVVAAGGQRGDTKNDDERDAMHENSPGGPIGNVFEYAGAMRRFGESFATAA
nr:hypothetical protein [Burkholderia multivorans]